MTIAEIEDVTCPVQGVVNGVNCTAECYFCDYYLQHMVNTAQDKLLGYLLSPLHPSEDGYRISAAILHAMRKELTGAK